MERKTIGSFIATLRKANGMTQRELAEKLNVTDKTVSRWETDEGLPDVTIIAVLAEIFGITCDELLRGERNNVFRADADDNADLSKKSEKQLQLIQKKALLNFRTLSFIAVGIALLGIVASMIANLGFLRAYIGFYSGMAFTIMAIVVETIGISRASSSVDEDVMAKSAMLQYRTEVMKMGFWTITAIAMLFSSTLVLLMAGDAYLGVKLSSVMSYGTLFGTIAIVPCLIVGFVGRNAFYKAGRYYVPEKRRVAFEHNNRLTARFTAILLTTLFITLIVQIASTNEYGPLSIARKMEFTDYESFREFMARRDPMSPRFRNRYMVTYYGNGQYVMGEEAPAPDTAITELEGETTYYDEYGNRISFETAHTRTLRDRSGNIVCTYRDFNENVASVMYEAGNGTVLPIKVITYDALYDARNTIGIMNMVFVFIYIAEIAIIGTIYFRKREK